MKFIIIFAVFAITFGDEIKDSYYQFKAEVFKRFDLEGHEFKGELACFEDKMINERPRIIDVIILKNIM